MYPIKYTPLSINVMIGTGHNRVEACTHLTVFWINMHEYIKLRKYQRLNKSLEAGQIRRVEGGGGVSKQGVKGPTKP